MQINGLLEHDISAPDAAAPKSAIRDAVQRTEAVVEDPQGKPLSTEIDGHVGWTAQTNEPLKQIVKVKLEIR